tara:strand:+ start:33 stop:1544 length:1512 start_codon:yes stop_codon:yes gene_type:complete
MKSFSNFIIETQSGGTKSGSGTEPDPWFPNKKNKNGKKKSKNTKKGIEPKEVNRRLSASTTKGDQARKQYNTSGIQGDSNPGPISNFEKKKLRQTASSNRKITVNYAEPDPQADTYVKKIKDSKDLKKLNQQKGFENLKSAISKARTPGEDALDYVSSKKHLDKVSYSSGQRKPDPKKGELGKLYKSSTKVDPKRGGSVRTTDKMTAELSAKRAARIDPKTGKATQKGVENFAINKLTKGLSTKGPTGREQLANAKKLASNPGSAAYRDIETKINTSDYAGKRAKLASTKELDKIAKDVKLSSTIGDKPSQTNIKVTKPKTATIKSINPNLNKSGGPVRSKYGKIKNPNPTKTFSQFRDTSATAIKSNAAKLKIKPGGLVGPAFAAWNAIDNYKAAKGSPLRKFTKAALTTGAYYKGGAFGASVGTAGGAITGPGAVVTGTAGFIAGGELASNLTSKAFDKVWKPPSTSTKIKTNNKKVSGTNTTGNKKKIRWKSGIAIGSDK